jgi:hypothetical protein
MKRHQSDTNVALGRYDRLHTGGNDLSSFSRLQDAADEK